MLSGACWSARQTRDAGKGEPGPGRVDHKLGRLYTQQLIQPNICSVDLVGYDVDLIRLRVQSNVGGSIPPLSISLLAFFFFFWLSPLYESAEDSLDFSRQSFFFPRISLTSRFPAVISRRAENA